MRFFLNFPFEAVDYRLSSDNNLKLQDDPLLFDYNVKDRVNDFIVAAIAQVHLTFTTLTCVLSNFIWQ